MTHKLRLVAPGVNSVISQILTTQIFDAKLILCWTIAPFNLHHSVSSTFESVLFAQLIRSLT